MTVKNNCVIAIATLRDWIKNLASVFQPMRCKTYFNSTSCAPFFVVTVKNSACNWFSALFPSVVINLSNEIGIGLTFRQSFENRPKKR